MEAVWGYNYFNKTSAVGGEKVKGESLMKKVISLLCIIALCMALPLCAMAEQKRPANCGTTGHYKEDGLNHNRPQSCWVDGHNYCDGMDHDWASCGRRHHFNCDGLDHEAAACGVEGHRNCDGNKHAAAPCGTAGHCVSDGKKHTPANCGTAGHYKCDGMAHNQPICFAAGHLACDGGDHTQAECGVYRHFGCDGIEHAAAPCGRSGHCTSDGLAHAPALCGHDGHYDCDGRNHEPAACGVAGHFACEARYHQHKPISIYCNAVPQHMTCEANDAMHYCDPAMGGCGDEYACRYSNAHTPCRMCGQLWCDYSLGGHETPCKNANHRPCVYAMNGKTYVRADHSWCGYCGGYKCENDGEHGNGKCVDSCPKCGGPEKLGVNHKAECGHYNCYHKAEHTTKCEVCGNYQCKCTCGDTEQ